MRGFGTRVVTATAYGAAALVALAAPEQVFYVLLAVVYVLARIELRRLEAAGSRLARPLAGGVYCAIGLGALALLRSQGPAVALVALVPTWASDVAAYLVGSAIGRHKIAPTISPGKTWEGTVGGVLAAAATAVAVCGFVGVPALATVLVAVTIGPAALLGDLLESAAKREAGAKDSGALLPGHGGVLDRIDSLLLVAPVVAVILAISRG